MNKSTGDLGDNFDRLLAARQPVWKKVKVLMPHCPFCGEQLRGNNSRILPYRCACGEWENDFLNPSYFRIKTNPQ
jgi:hypothetical protein